MFSGTWKEDGTRKQRTHMQQGIEKDFQRNHVFYGNVQLVIGFGETGSNK